MQLALAFRAEKDRRKSGGKILTAEDYLKLRESGKAEGLQLCSPYSLTPMVFRGPGRCASGRTIRPHFARASGYGLEGSIYDRESAASLKQALEDPDRKILIGILPEASQRGLMFDGIKNGVTVPFADWYMDNLDEYFYQSVKSATEIITVIQRAAEAARKTNVPVRDKLFFFYRGAVMKYQDFYLGSRKDDIANLDTRLRAGKEGITIGEARRIGFPRLIKFLPTKSTLSEKGARGLKGNSIDINGGRTKILLNLTFNDPLCKMTAEYQTMWRELEGKQSLYVLASPFVALDEEAALTANANGNGLTGLNWQIMLWTINDIEAQTAPVKRPHIIRPEQHLIEYHARPGSC